MSEPTPRKLLPTWLAGAIVTLLSLQLALLWMQGSMLERQHGTLLSLRQDIQELTESLDDYQSSADSGASGEALRPTLHRGHGHRPLQRVRLQEQQEQQERQDREGDGQQALKKELEAQRKSEKDAVAKAREVRSQLSYEENARKAEEKARIEAETHKYRPLIWIGVVVALGAMFLRSWMRNRG
jgi:FtsZ-interacting cell division protein ZipA